MKKYIPIIILILIVGALAWFLYGKKTGTVPPPAVTEIAADAPTEFSDGLAHPTSSREFKLDEMGAGIAQENTYATGNMQITRVRVENGTDHFYYDYKIYLNGRDITPDGFRTTEGAECALAKLRFESDPFRVVKISRPWADSWITPTMATRTVYELQGDTLAITSTTQLRRVCDVAGLF